MTNAQIESRMQTAKLVRDEAVARRAKYLKPSECRSIGAARV